MNLSLLKNGIVRWHLAAWAIMALLIPGRALGEIPIEVSLADKQGRVWAYALVDTLEEANFSTQEKKEIYHLIMEQELKPIGIKDVDAMMAASKEKVRVYQTRLQPEVMAKNFSTLRIPYEKPFLNDTQLAVTAPEKEFLKSFFMQHLYGHLAIRPRTTTDLRAMHLGTTVLDSMKSTLNAWSAKKGDNTFSAKTYEAVETSLRTTMERLSKDEVLINEAWKFAISRKFGE